MTSTSQTPDLTTSTTSPQEERPDAAAMWVTTIEALQAYKAECELMDQLDLSRDLDLDAKRAGVDK